MIMNIPVKKMFVHFVLLLGLAGCSSTFRSEVVRFHDLTAPHGNTVTVVPGEGIEDGPEFRQYADMVIAKLSREGFVAAGEEEPDLIVKVSYGVLRQEPRSSRPYWSSSYYFGFGHHYYPYGYYYPYYYGGYYGGGYGGLYGYSDSLYDRPRHERMLEVIISQPDENVIFEGRVVSKGRTTQLVNVMPYLVEALFTGFPGESGELIRVSIKEDDLPVAP